MHRNVKPLLLAVALILLLTPACALTNLLGPEEAPPPTPSRTPKPTFTPTPPVTLTPIVAPTSTPTLEATPTPLPTDTPVEPPPTDTPAATATPEPPTDTPVPETARAVIDNPTLNVRQGPGTNYSILGTARNGERYDLQGKNSAGTWWQIDFNGRSGWVSGDFVRTEGDVSSIQVAANIPPPPAPTATPRPTQPPAPTATPRPQFAYSYQQGSMVSAQNCGSVYLEGKVVDAGGNGINGVTVMLEFFGNRVFRVTGVGKGAGEWGFTPLALEYYKVAVPFNLRVVESEGNPSPISDNHFIDFRTCEQAGQFTNIVFRKN